MNTLAFEQFTTVNQEELTMVSGGFGPFIPDPPYIPAPIFVGAVTGATLGAAVAGL
ncbi:class IIb bacteriocin, lactobin A/cerein 7B family [Streptococcus orisasini]|uniref:class IIb bacteriocin, lactobin A/cerein 7B family n=1 Tax=Streptococcus orisasini TaxID=1080071 RepID=UPI000A50072E|nr:class IIb bacteriocin, lactobin A/cerein 7B family [Streptococcus orisasini]